MTLRESERFPKHRSVVIWAVISFVLLLAALFFLLVTALVEQANDHFSLAESIGGQRINARLHRRLLGLVYYRDGPLVARVCGVRRLPVLATVSRTLASFDDESVENLCELNLEIVIDLLREFKLDTLTVDFDGSV